MRNNLYICNANPQTKTTLTSPICGSNFGTHYNFFVRGPFSLAHITTYIIVNILIIIAATFVATFLFVKLNNLANRLVFDKLLKN